MFRNQRNFTANSNLSVKKVENSVRQSISTNFRNSSKNHAEYHTLKQAIIKVSGTMCDKK